MVGARDGAELAVRPAVEQVLAERVRGVGTEASHEVDAQVIQEAKVLLGDRGRVGGRVQEDRAIRDREEQPVGRVDAERGHEVGDVRRLRRDEEGLAADTGEGAAGALFVDGFAIRVDLPVVVELVESDRVLREVSVGDRRDGVREVEAQAQGETAGEGARVAEVGVGGQVRDEDACAHALA